MDAMWNLDESAQLRRARGDLRRALAWASTQVAGARSPEALIVVAWGIEQVADAVRRSAVGVLEESGCSPQEIGDLPGLWLPAERVVAALAR